MTVGLRYEHIGKQVYSYVLFIATAQKKGMNRKTTQPSTRTQTQAVTDNLRDFDQQISALERDNIKLKKDNIKLKGANVKLKGAVDRVSSMKLLHSSKI